MRREVEISTLEELLKVLKNETNIYIYGAGNMGMLAYVMLIEKKIYPKAFLVTQTEKRYFFSINTPILQYRNAELEKEAIVLIAALGKNQVEILSECNNNRVIVLNECFYKKYYEINCNRIDKIKRSEKKFIYNMTEKIIYENSFQNIECGTKNEQLKKLLNNLDEASKNVIMTCLKRIQIINDFNEKEIDIFTDLEKMNRSKAIGYIENYITKEENDSWRCHDYYLPINDFRTEIFYDKLGIGIIEDISVCMNKGVIDVGGYIGDSALIFSKITSKNVYVFEPIRKYIELIEKTKKLNKTTNIIPINKAASYCSGKEVFEISDNDYTSGLVKVGKRNYKERVEVETISIDEFVCEHGLNIGMIKIHAEGAEQLVIKGAAKTIKNQSPIVIVEINHTESDFFDIKPQLENLNPNYKFKVYKPDNGCICLGLKLIAEVI